MQGGSLFFTRTRSRAAVASFRSFLCRAAQKRTNPAGQGAQFHNTRSCMQTTPKQEQSFTSFDDSERCQAGVCSIRAREPVRHLGDPFQDLNHLGALSAFEAACAVQTEAPARKPAPRVNHASRQVKLGMSSSALPALPALLQAGSPQLPNNQTHLTDEGRKAV